MSCDTGQSQIIGIVIGGIILIVGTILGAFLTYVFAERRDRKRDNAARQKREEATYRRLKGFANRIASSYILENGVRYNIPLENLEIIDLIIAQNIDVLDTSTVAAWDDREIIEPTESIPHSGVKLEAFLDDVNKHFEKFKHTAIPPQTRVCKESISN
jgi:hypothetical protein